VVEVSVLIGVIRVAGVFSCHDGISDLQAAR